MTPRKPTVRIREAIAADTTAITHLLGVLGYPTTDRLVAERLESIAGDASCVTLVAEDAGAVVGFVGGRLGLAYERDGRYLDVRAIAVDPASQGSGVGTALMLAIEAWGRDRGANLAALSSGRHRTDAHAFYRRRGYESTGLRFRKELGGP